MSWRPLLPSGFVTSFHLSGLTATEKRFEAYRLPKGKAERQRYAEQVGADGFHLLQALDSEAAPSWVREVLMV